MDTGRGASHTEVCEGELGEGQLGVGSWGRDNMGRNARMMMGRKAETTLPCIYLCNNPACSSHVPQNLKYNKIFFKNLKKKNKKLKPQNGIRSQKILLALGKYHDIFL